MPTDDQRKLTTKRDYSKISKMYADDFGADRDHFDFIDQAIKLVKEKRLDKLPCIDLGCGSGVVTDYLVEKCLQSIAAVDLTPEFCKMIEEKHGDKAKVFCGDMVETVSKQKPSSVASYFASFSIIHIPDEEIEGLFASIYRIPRQWRFIRYVMSQGHFQRHGTRTLSDTKRFKTHRKGRAFSLHELLHRR